MTRRSTVAYKPFATIGVLLLLSSCTVSCKTKDGGGKEMAESLENILKMGGFTDFTTVTCPRNAKAAAGKKIDCKVAFKNGNTVTFVLVWKNDALLKDWYPLLDRAKVEKRLPKAQNLQNVKSVACPARMPQKPKAKHPCKVTLNDGKTITVMITVDDKLKIGSHIAKGKATPTKPPAPAPPK